MSRQEEGVASSSWKDPAETGSEAQGDTRRPFEWARVLRVAWARRRHRRRAEAHSGTTQASRPETPVVAVLASPRSCRSGMNACPRLPALL